MTVEKWLESCPLPVVARVVSSVDDLRMIGISAKLYQAETLVVVPLETLQKLIESMKNV